MISRVTLDGDPHALTAADDQTIICFANDMALFER
jgi:hypothetical protein